MTHHCRPANYCSQAKQEDREEDEKKNLPKSSKLDKFVKCKPKNLILDPQVSQHQQKQQISTASSKQETSEATNMSKTNVKQRQRHKLSLNYSSPIVVTLVVVHCLVLQNILATCQPQPSDSSSSRHPLATQLQYNRHRSSNNNNNLNLVNNQQQIFAHSSPLTRQQQQQGTDLDNVIESTTSLLSLQQNVAATMVDASETSSGSSVAGGCQLPPTWTGKWYQSNREPIRITNTEISDKGVCRDQKGDKYLFEYSGGSKQHAAVSATATATAVAPPTAASSSSASNEAPCLVCLRFIDRHLNALQYKESSCQPIPANYYNRSTQNLIVDDHSLLDSICDDINGDNPLESLFRLDTPPIECPISGQYMFTYDNCREAQSTLDSCIDKKQLNFKFSSCPDVAGSESKCK